MKNLFTLFLLFLTFTLNAQIDTPPTGANFKTLPTYTFKWYTTDSTLWMYKGATYGWTNISEAYDSLENYRLLNNHDSLSKLQEKSYHSLVDTPNLDLKANVDDPTFTTKITTPALNIPTSAAENYFWKCTNASTGAGAWTAISASQLYKGTVDGDDGVPTVGGSALIDGTGTAGWFYVCTDAGTYDYGNPNGNSITLALNDQIHYNGTIWQKVPAGSSQWITTGSDIYYNSGNVGIGTITPAKYLHLSQSINGEAEMLIIQNTYPSISVQSALGFTFNTADADPAYLAKISSNISNRSVGTNAADLRFYTTNGGTLAERMRITDGGNVGIGVSPTKRLHIAESLNGESGMLIQNTYSGTSIQSSLWFGFNTASADPAYLAKIQTEITNRSAGTEATNMYFNTTVAGTTASRMSIVGGNIGIGKTPSTELDVNGVITATAGTSTQWNTAYTHSQIAGGTGVHVSDAERTTWNAKEPALGNPGTSGFVLSSTTGGVRSWISASTINGTGFVKATGTTISYDNSTYLTTASASSTYVPYTGASGNVTIGAYTLTASNFILSSDKRLKKNISPIKKAFNVKFVQFNLKSEPDQLRYGVIAQDVEKYYPELVRIDAKGMKSVAYIDLLIGKIHELEQRIEQLEKANDENFKRDKAIIDKLRYEK